MTWPTEVGSDPAEDLETQVSSCVGGDFLSLELGLRLGLQTAPEGRSAPLGKCLLGGNQKHLPKCSH